MGEQQLIELAGAVRAAMEHGDYNRAVALAVKLVPDMERQLEQFRVQMLGYDQARARQDWRRAFRHLADARLAGLAAGMPELAGGADARIWALVGRHGVSLP